MLYSILIYAKEGVFERLPEDTQAAEMQKHIDLQNELQAQGSLGPVVKLMSTTAAMTVRKTNKQLLVTDGPFAETKEQFLGFYVIECDCIEEAIAAAKKLPEDLASYEIRPIAWAGGTLSTD